MKNRISQPNLYVRTAYYFDKLRTNTGMGHRQLWELVNRTQYLAHGLEGPSLETVRDYSRARRSLAVDFGHAAVPPWLMAAELQFPHSSYNYFHPLFDLLFGHVESSLNWTEKLNKIPVEWIEEERRSGNADIANNWEKINEGLTARRGRKPKKEIIDRLSFVHLNLLRLPEKIKEVLFTRAKPEGTYFRRYQPIADEIEDLRSRRNIDGLCAFVGLVFEASSIRDMVRLNIAKNALRESLRIIGEVKECQRFNYLLMRIIERECLRTTNPKYYLALHHGFGLPMSWRAGAGAALLEDADFELTNFNEFSGALRKFSGR